MAARGRRWLGDRRYRWQERHEQGHLANVAVLPAHGKPFRGAHERIDAISAEHLRRLEALHEHLAEPRRVVDTFGVLFGRRVPAGHRVLATGEAIAHLNYLLAEGDAVATQDSQGVRWFRRT